MLFLFSGVSSGIAATVLCSVALFKEPLHSPALAFVHRLEKPVVWLELFLLLAFFYRAMVWRWSERGGGDGRIGRRFLGFDVLVLGDWLRHGAAIGSKPLLQP